MLTKVTEILRISTEHVNSYNTLVNKKLYLLGKGPYCKRLQRQ